MSKLEIQYFTGDLEERELSRSQPVSVGRHASSDVCINEDDVALMHCRISWNGEAFEVVAANPEGVEVNGTLVRNAVLHTGDVIRVGTVDIRPQLEPSEAAEAVAAAAGSDSQVEAGSSRRSGRRERVAAGGRGERAPASESFFESEVDDEGEDYYEEYDEASQPPAEPPPSRRPVARPEERTPRPEPRLEPEDDQPRRGRSREPQKGPAWLRKAGRSLRDRPYRPGEQPVLKSKFINYLAGGAVVLVLTGVVVWFMMWRNIAGQLYDKAKEELEDGNYQSASELFGEFLRKYPRHDLVDQAAFGKGHAEVQRQIGVSNWSAALKAVDDFIKVNRDREGYDAEKSRLREYAETIATGAVETVKKRADAGARAQAETIAAMRELMNGTAVAARNLARSLEAGGGFENRFRLALQEAIKAVEKREQFTRAAEEIEEALADDDPMTALRKRMELIDRYKSEGFSRQEQADLDGLLTKTLDAERRRVRSEEIDREAITKDRPERLLEPRSLTLHVTPRTGEKSQGERLVFASAPTTSCCYGIDAITGEPLWRRVTGFNRPFFPVLVEAREPALLIYDTDFGELVLVRRSDGGLLWRQPLHADGEKPERVTGPPLIHDGCIYVCTKSARMYKLDLHSGKLVSRLEFSQNVGAPPALVADGQRLVVAGETALLYTLTPAPLACESVSHSGHHRGGVEAPLTPIGRLLLMCENDRQSSCRLRVLNSRPEALDARGWLGDLAPESAQKNDDDPHRVPGQVRDRPEIRANKLFVISSGERVNVFTVTDEQRPPQADPDTVHYLKFLARSPGKGDHSGPVYLVDGPNGEFWLLGSRFRKMQLKTDTIQPDPRERAWGTMLQPPQTIGEHIYLGRRHPPGSGLIFSRFDRQEMQGQWRCVLGAAPLAWGAGGSTAFCVTTGGEVFRVGADEIRSGGFETEAIRQLIIHKDDEESFDDVTALHAVRLSDGRIAAWSDGEEPQMWIVRDGLVEREFPLTGELQADPVLIDSGLILPLKGRLKLVRLSPGGGAVEDYEMAAGGDQPPAWTHLASLEGDQLIAADESGTVVRIHLQSEAGREHLAKVQERRFAQPVAGGFVVHSGRIVTADAGGGLLMLDAATMETVSTVDPGGQVTRPLSLVEGLVFVEVDSARLRCFAVGEELRDVWRQPLEFADGFGLAGAPLPAGGMLVAVRRNGDVWLLDPATGERKDSRTLGVAVDLPPRSLAGEIVVCTVDGSLYRVDFPGPSQ